MRISDWSSDVCSSDLFHKTRDKLMDTRFVLIAPAERRGRRIRPNIIQYLALRANRSRRIRERVRVRGRSASERPHGEDYEQLAGDDPQSGRSRMADGERSEERREGQTGVSKCQSRG